MERRLSEPVTVTRVGDGPIIHPGLDPSIGENIQGPSLLQVPDWVAKPLGKYYLYFADHKGGYIRLAYADQLAGPWRIHVPGSLQLAQSHFLTVPPPITAEQQAQAAAQFAAAGISVPHDVAAEVTTPHIASPDVHADSPNRRIIMYYHGLESLGHQVTRVATSADGIHFDAQPQMLGRTYFRAFNWQQQTYGLAMPGQFYRADNPFGPFSKGPQLFNPNMRHCAVLVRKNVLWIFWTQVGDAPEHIKVSTLHLAADWQSWRATEGVEVLRPELPWEGADAPLQPSMRSTAYGMVNQLRDPAIFCAEPGADTADHNGAQVYLLYAVAGESGIALATVDFSDD